MKMEIERKHTGIHDSVKEKGSQTNTPDNNQDKKHDLTNCQNSERPDHDKIHHLKELNWLFKNAVANTLSINDPVPVKSVKRWVRTEKKIF